MDALIEKADSIQQRIKKSPVQSMPDKEEKLKLYQDKVSRLQKPSKS